MGFSKAFQQSRGLLLTTFTNKVGSIGLSLIPILLVGKGVSTAEGSVVLSALKVMIIAGTLAGGALSDRIGSRPLLLASFLLSAAGLGFLPFQSTVLLILVFGLAAQFAESLGNVAQRLLLMRQVDPENQKEALGWLRTAINFAQFFTYAIAAATSAFGVAPLMVFDSVTALTAFFLGRRLLPAAEPAAPAREPGAGAKAPASRAAFFGCALVFLGWSMFYELFMEGAAGRLEVLHPGQGLRRFSLIMMVNVLFCFVFAVRATKVFSRSLTAITWGMLLTAAGILIAAWGMSSMAWVCLGMLLITGGELMLGAVSQYTLMRLTPESKNSGAYYSLGLTLMQGGRIIGAALAFPLLIHAGNLVTLSVLVASVTALLLGVLYSQRGEIARFV